MEEHKHQKWYPDALEIFKEKQHEWEDASIGNTPKLQLFEKPLSILVQMSVINGLDVTRHNSTELSSWQSYKKEHISDIAEILINNNKPVDFYVEGLHTPETLIQIYNTIKDAVKDPNLNRKTTHGIEMPCLWFQFCVLCERVLIFHDAPFEQTVMSFVLTDLLKEDTMENVRLVFFLFEIMYYKQTLAFTEDNAKLLIEKMKGKPIEIKLRVFFTETSKLFKYNQHTSNYKMYPWLQEILIS